MATDSTKTEVGSYFISNYPPYSQWSPEQLPEVEAAMGQPPGDVPLGLYLHIPFCRKRCKFCYFRVYTDKNARRDRDLCLALCREKSSSSASCRSWADGPFRFVYFGGGTPSFLSPQAADVTGRSPAGRTSTGIMPRKSRSSANPARSPNPRCTRSGNWA